jgi:hypothetical protein
MGGRKKRKMVKRLEDRRAAYDAIPQNNDSQNPGKQSGGGHKMRRPGSGRK